MSVTSPPSPLSHREKGGRCFGKAPLLRATLGSTRRGKRGWGEVKKTGNFT
jgi:hypothetical protein